MELNSQEIFLPNASLKSGSNQVLRGLWKLL